VTSGRLDGGGGGGGGRGAGGGCCRSRLDRGDGHIRGLNWQVDGGPWELASLVKELDSVEGLGVCSVDKVDFRPGQLVQGAVDVGCRCCREAGADWRLSQDVGRDFVGDGWWWLVVACAEVAVQVRVVWHGSRPSIVVVYGNGATVNDGDCAVDKEDGIGVVVSWEGSDGLGDLVRSPVLGKSRGQSTRLADGKGVSSSKSRGQQDEL